MTEVVKGYSLNLPHNVKCQGCGIICGIDTPYKVIYHVAEGVLTGYFHSRACFENALQEKGLVKNENLPIE